MMCPPVDGLSVVPSQPEEPGSPSGGHGSPRRAERRGVVSPGVPAVLLARSEAAGERRGVIVRSTTACRWRSHLADDKVLTGAFGKSTKCRSSSRRPWMALVHSIEWGPDTSAITIEASIDPTSSERAECHR